MKRLLNIADREKVESGEYKVTTRDGRKARVIYWDAKNEVYPIVALIASSDGSETAYTFTEKGEYYEDVTEKLDLFVEVPDERIPFDMKYKEDILAGRVKVRTAAGDDVRIISFDGLTQTPVVGIVRNCSVEYWTITGRYREDGLRCAMDIVIIKPE